MRSIYLIVVVLFSCNQASERKTIINYCGQKTPGENAELFAPGIISTSSFEHSAPSFSADGQTVLWAVMEMPSYHTRILQMDFANGKWSQPHSPAFCDTMANEVYPSFSPDGKDLYFSSSRKINDNDTLAKGNRLWKVKKNSNGWETPILLDTVVSKGGEYASSVADNGNLYFTFGPFRSPDWNIYKTEMRSNKYSEPVKLSLNGAGYEDGPFVAPDESYLIFESKRPESINNSIDLFICFKNQDGRWSDPKNMGPKINSTFDERFSRVSPDGKYLFFGSNRNQTGTQKGFDIYWIDAAIIEKLRERE